MFIGRVVHGAKFSGEKYYGVSCHEVSCPWGQVAMGASCPGSPGIIGMYI
jgi:hypothetical protein